MSLLVDQFGRDFTPGKKPETRVISAAPIADSTRRYVADAIKPRRLAGIFKDADAGDMERQAELFELVTERDAHLLGEVTKRVNGVLNLDFTLTPAGDDARDIKIYEFAQKHMFGADGQEEILLALQQAAPFGYAGLEICWDTSTGQAVPADFEYIPPQRFIFRDDKGYLSRRPKLVTDEAGMGIEIDPWKVILHTYGGKSKHPAKSGVLRPCCWMYLFKHYTIQDWITFCEVYGMPMRVGKYDPAASEADKKALAKAIMGMATDAAGIISSNTIIEFIASAAQGSGHQTYSQAIDFFNKEISKAMLGQTLSAELGSSGSLAATETHNEIRLDLLESDGRALAATIEKQLIRPLVGFNFGWDAPLPKYQAALKKNDDLSSKSTWVTSLLNCGVTMPLKWLRESFNIPEPEEDEKLVGGQTQTQQGFSGMPWAAKQVVAKAQTPAPAYTDLLTDKLAKETAPEIEGWITQIEAGIFDGAKDLDDVADKLLALYPGMGTNQLAGGLRQALLAAELESRYEVTRRR